jgi:hypothetical protein
MRRDPLPLLAELSRPGRNVRDDLDALDGFRLSHRAYVRQDTALTKGERSGQGEFATSKGVAANTIANADFLATGL